MAAQSGYRGRVLVDNLTRLRCHRWQFSSKVQEEDVTIFRAPGDALAGFTEVGGGFVQSELVLELFWDPSDNPFLSIGLNLVVNTVHRFDVFFDKRDPSSSYTLYKGLITSVTGTAEVRNPSGITLTATGASNFLYPFATVALI